METLQKILEGNWIPKYFDFNLNKTIPGQYEEGKEGHWMARAYFKAGEIYREMQNQNKVMGIFHMYLLDKTTAEKAGAIVDPNIHPHRYENRFDPELKQLAQV